MKPQSPSKSALMPVNFFGLDRQALAHWFSERGERAYRATQVLRWVHQHRELQVNDWSNLSQSWRESLQSQALFDLPKIVQTQVSKDGTRKWLLELADGNRIETVFIPEAKRGTLCVSSQVGCALNCSFCSTAQQGFNRNLTVAEIIGQLWLANGELAAANAGQTVTNVVMMGMGEPLLNFDNVLAAMNLMMDDYAYGLSKRRVTLSTSGVVPAMRELSELSDASWAVSLHAPNDELRNEIVPINKKYPIAELIAACRDHCREKSNRHITIEYVMLRDVNDQEKHARQLIKLLRNLPCKINLIPFNPFPNARYKCSLPDVIERFRTQLVLAGYTVVTRKTRGDDIDAACGQLAGDFKDRTKRRERLQRNAREES